jgi:hypothetical protein
MPVIPGTGEGEAEGSFEPKEWISNIDLFSRERKREGVRCWWLTPIILAT